MALACLAVAAVVLISISGIPRFKNADYGVDAVIGNIGWWGGCLAVLAFLILLVRTIWIARKRSRTKAQASTI